jgi:N-acetylglutamate synthase-like GNAT family acetyltransferase
MPAIKTERVYIRMTEELLNRYKAESQKLGINTVALMTIALNEYFVQKDMTQTVIDMVQTQKTKKDNENNA